MESGAGDWGIFPKKGGIFLVGRDIIRVGYRGRNEKCVRKEEGRCETTNADIMRRIGGAGAWSDRLRKRRYAAR